MNSAAETHTNCCGCIDGLRALRPRRKITATSAESLRKQLREARQVVSLLEQQLDIVLSDRLEDIEQARYADALGEGKSRRKPITVFVDGAFDLMHFGHANAFRQARLLGDRLVVGVNSDASIAECKAPPVLRDSERQAAVAACRFVDDIIPASPYIMTESYIEDLVENHGIDLFVHGDDPCIVNGRDVYEAAKRAGRYRSIPRTEGVSTTDIVGRALLLTREHHMPLSSDGFSPSAGQLASKSLGISGTPVALRAKSLVTSNLYGLFMATLPEKKAGDIKVVYIDGAWDMFHAGHIATLRKARELGDWLIVGVHSDATVNEHRGGNYPIMNMQERTLNLLGCRYVDDILLDAPWKVSREMIASLRISLVVRGTAYDQSLVSRDAGEEHDPHAVPIAMGISRVVESEVTLTVDDILSRIQENRERIAKRHEVKAQSEAEWYRNKHGLQTP